MEAGEPGAFCSRGQGIIIGKITPASWGLFQAALGIKGHYTIGGCSEAVGW